MLLLGSKTFTVDGITVFSDHADPEQFWYLPAPVTLERRADSDEPQFTLIKYRPAVAAAGVKGGGYLMFTAAIPIDAAKEQAIAARISTYFPDVSSPRLAAVPYDEGTVQCVALNLQGPGGTAAPAAKEGTFEAVEKILGASIPSLMGNNDAVFSLELSQEGATILEAAFDNELEPVGVIYQLKYTGVRPALDVKITADLKRAYESFSAGLSAQVYYVQVGIDATWEKLVQDGAIKVTVTNLAPNDADNKNMEQWAINLFKENLLADWFKPSLSPTTAQAADVGVPSLPTTPAASTADPAADKAAAEKAAAEKTAAEKTLAEKTAAAKAAATKATADKAAADKAANDKAAADKAAAASGSEADKAAATKAAADKLAADKAAAASSAEATKAETERAAAEKALADKTAATKTATPPAAGTTAEKLAAAEKAAAEKAAAAAKGVLPAVSGTNPANTSTGSAPFGAALRLRYVHQDELKTVEVEYHRQDAVQRVYAPQGYFGAMLSKLDRSKHLLDVDLDDAFFRELHVTVTPPKDFAAIGLTALHVSLDYGDPRDIEHHKHDDHIFDLSSQAPWTWRVYKNPTDSREYSRQIDWHFDPASGWAAEKFSYSFAAEPTENADLYLNPFEFLTFAEVRVSPGRIDWNVIDFIEADFTYTSPSGWQTSQHFELRSDTKTQSWKLRLEGRAALAYTWKLTHHLKDGTTVARDEVKSNVPAVVVQDPFVFLPIQVQPLFDPAKTKLAYLDLACGDEASGYEHEEQLTLSPASSAAVKVRLPMLDPKNKHWRYRLTLVGQSNQIQRGAWTESDVDVIFITDEGAQ